MQYYLEYDHKIAIILSIIYARVNERQGADIQTKVEELEELNQSLRNRDKMKDDAIAQLSDATNRSEKEGETNSQMKSYFS
jgi:hypothetical protein